MKIIELDLTGCSSLSEIHERIKVAFDFPQWYGKNWSAFWDLLWSDCDANKVIIKGEHSLSVDFDKHIDKLHEILERNIAFCKKYNLDSFSYEIIS